MPKTADRTQTKERHEKARCISSERFGRRSTNRHRGDCRMGGRVYGNAPPVWLACRVGQARRVQHLLARWRRVGRQRDCAGHWRAWKNPRDSRPRPGCREHGDADRRSVSEAHHRQQWPVPDSQRLDGDARRRGRSRESRADVARLRVRGGAVLCGAHRSDRGIHAGAYG